MNNLDQPASSSRAVVKALEGLGFNGVELWKNPATKHYVFSVYHCVNQGSIREKAQLASFSSETIYYYDLRASDWTIREWLHEFLNKAEESEWNEDFHQHAKILNPLVENLRNVVA